MDGVILIVIIGAVVLYQMGPAKRARLKRQIDKGLGGGRRSTARRQPPPPASTQRPIESRPSSLPPPTAPSTPPPTAAVPEPVEIVHPDPVPAPSDPIVVDMATDDSSDETGPETPPPTAGEPTSAADRSPGSVDLTVSATIETLFLQSRNAQQRLDTFEQHYAGNEVEWRADVVRVSTSRRDGQPAKRVELLLGYASDNEFHSDRVLAEAYFDPDAELERDATITFRATLTDANVLARRLVLDDARLT